MAKGGTSSSSPIPSHTLFLDTSLDTHLAITVSEEDSIKDLKQKILMEHLRCFPTVGEITIQALKVRRKAYFYHLSDSMLVKSAFNGVKGSWFVHVDASKRVSVPDILLLPQPEGVEIVKQLAPSETNISCKNDKCGKRIRELPSDDIGKVLQSGFDAKESRSTEGNVEDSSDCPEKEMQVENDPENHISSYDELKLKRVPENSLVGEKKATTGNFDGLSNKELEGNHSSSFSLVNGRRKKQQKSSVLSEGDSAVHSSQNIALGKEKHCTPVQEVSGGNSIQSTLLKQNGMAAKAPVGANSLGAKDSDEIGGMKLESTRDDLEGRDLSVKRRKESKKKKDTDTMESWDGLSNKELEGNHSSSFSLANEKRKKQQKSPVLYEGDSAVLSSQNNALGKGKHYTPVQEVSEGNPIQSMLLEQNSMAAKAPVGNIGANSLGAKDSDEIGSMKLGSTRDGLEGRDPSAKRRKESKKKKDTDTTEIWDGLSNKELEVNHSSSFCLVNGKRKKQQKSSVLYDGDSAVHSSQTALGKKKHYTPVQEVSGGNLIQSTLLEQNGMDAKVPVGNVGANSLVAKDSDEVRGTKLESTGDGLDGWDPSAKRRKKSKKKNDTDTRLADHSATEINKEGTVLSHAKEEKISKVENGSSTEKNELENAEINIKGRCVSESVDASVGAEIMDLGDKRRKKSKKSKASDEEGGVIAETDDKVKNKSINVHASNSDKFLDQPKEQVVNTGDFVPPIEENLEEKPSSKKRKKSRAKKSSLKQLSDAMPDAGNNHTNGESSNACEFDAGEKCLPKDNVVGDLEVPNVGGDKVNFKYYFVHKKDDQNVSAPSKEHVDENVQHSRFDKEMEADKKVELTEKSQKLIKNMAHKKKPQVVSSDTFHLDESKVTHQPKENTLVTSGEVVKKLSFHDHNEAGVNAKVSWKENSATSNGSSSSMESEEKKFGSNKRHYELKTPSSGYHVAFRKSYNKKMGDGLKSSRDEKNLLATSKAIFEENSGESSEDVVNKSEGSTRSPSDNSSSSYDSEGENGETVESLHNGSGAQRIMKNLSKSNSKSTGLKDLSLDTILRSSRSYKKAKLTASQSQPEDGESQTIDCVLDSQA